MRLLIVDDEPPARARLRRLLAAHADVRVVGDAADGVQALALAAAHAPDALLLDVQMPELDGLEVAASLPDPAPALVFVTAHDRFALRAFDAAALDYLLKPVSPELLARALDRLRARLARLPPPRAALPAQATPPQRLLVPDRDRLHVLAVADITWLQAADNYVAVHTAAGAAPLLRRTLSGLLADLGPRFARCHRGAAVALAQVAECRTLPGGDAVLRLRDGHQLPCSRRHRAALVERLQRLGVAG